MHLAEQDRAALVEEHREGDEPDHGREQEQGERAHGTLDGAAGAEIGALARARPARNVGRCRGRRHAQHLGQDVQLHAVPGAAVLGEGPQLRRQAVSRPGDHEALRMDALDGEVGDDPIEVLGLAEDRDVVHVAPARGARILDDADHPQAAARHRLDRADEQGGHRAAAVQQHRQVARRRRARGARAGAPDPGLGEPVGEPRAAEERDQDQPLDHPQRGRHRGRPAGRPADGEEQDDCPGRRLDDRGELADRGVAPDSSVQTEREERRSGQREEQRSVVGEEPQVGPDRLPVSAQQRCQPERCQRGRQVMSEDDERPRDRRHGPPGAALRLERAVCRSSQR
jgi:hypothetical protein